MAAVPMPSTISATAALIDELDKKLICVLRDGRKLIGYLRSVDQFANLVLQDTVERYYVGNEYGDVPVGIYIIRGENVALLGEMDASADQSRFLKQVDAETILRKHAELPDADKRRTQGGDEYADMS
ncbi:uncharacterized protein MONBRDRAFT_20273 [Monosiga brevicollis MX1]|uniref:U6 snRNA-associated Sm-like protein LSm1 n=1 Tax=Monosiga brevicollis TaxID=81824 RepID=A9UVA4_MONBE|nr:uncharacterized protein MONBRDRAFT_20273 [Monosiga brevicollis MX1]EDQ91046.1 predicted protein [Monosiga brevicollis MX1]|eukprot:XP_001744343.1 hypothetical protein [Monosiga brevicollis MX1]